MMKQLYRFPFHLIRFFLILIFSVNTVDGQSDSAIINNADTINFSVNHNEDWILYNSYVSQEVEDSVTLEVILRHEKSSLDPDESWYIGTIKNVNLIPVQEQSASCFLLANEFEIKILPDGRCFLRLVTGALPETNPVVLPLRIRFYLGTRGEE